MAGGAKPKPGGVECALAFVPMFTDPILLNGVWYVLLGILESWRAMPQYHINKWADNKALKT